MDVYHKMSDKGKKAYELRKKFEKLHNLESDVSKLFEKYDCDIKELKEIIVKILNGEVVDFSDVVDCESCKYLDTDGACYMSTHCEYNMLCKEYESVDI